MPVKREAILYMSFGGPEGMGDVMPFLERVTRGRNIPRDRLLEVAEHYNHRGGVSPINAQNRALIDALQQLISERGPDLPVYFGNRNWHPLIDDTMQQMADDGITDAYTFVTAPHSCYSGCRQYRENLDAARQAVGEQAPTIHKLRVFFNHPGFIEPIRENVAIALASLPEHVRGQAVIAYTAHSVPMSMAESSDYVAQLTETCRLVSEAFENHPWKLVYQSRSGPPHMPWLEPDICDHLKTLKDENAAAVVVVPIGFISDHMEVVHDLDTEAREAADALNLPMARAATVGTHPRFVEMVRELIVERMDPASPRLALGNMGPRADICAPDCCPAPVRPSRLPNS